MKKWKRKDKRKKIMIEHTSKKKVKKAKKAKKLHISIKRTKVWLYQEKWLKFRIEQSNTRGILNFRAKGIKYFGSLKTKWKFYYICPVIGQTEGILTSSVIRMYVTVK